MILKKFKKTFLDWIANFIINLVNTTVVKNRIIDRHDKELSLKHDSSRNAKFELENFSPFNYPQYPNIIHEKIKPMSTFSPWRSDKEFIEMFEQLKNFTHIDIYRLYELFSLAKYACILKGDFLEVGVAQGGSGVMLSRTLNLMRSDKKIFLADTFAGVVNTSLKDPAYQDGMHSYGEDIVTSLLKKFACENNSIILSGIFPKKNYEPFNNRDLCFVHIDVDVYISTKEVLDFVNNKLVKNGLIIIDDYGFAGCEGATQAVKDFIEANKKSYILIHNINGHAILVKL